MFESKLKQRDIASHISLVEAKNDYSLKTMV